MVQASSIPHGFVLETKDPDQAASLLKSAAVPYASELLPGSPAFSTKIFVIENHPLSLARVVTTGLMRVNSCMPAGCFALVLDLAGNGLGQHRTGADIVPVGPEFGFIQSPLQPVEILTTPNYEVLFLRISRDAVMVELQKMLGREMHRELIFSPAIRLRSAAGQRLLALCTGLRRTLYRTDKHQLDRSLPLLQLEDGIIHLLLQSQSHNYTRLLHRNHEAGRYQLDTAEQFIRANAHLPLSLGDICEAAGVNARTLQHCFRGKRGCTPMEFLRKIRMEEVRNALTQPIEETSVSSEASRWGFLHFGRFSGEYREIYGELPSQTLHRARNKN